jgi:FAD/FMN-containing dehydrogenase/Fe-S oxidoreductase
MGRQATGHEPDRPVREEHETKCERQATDYEPDRPACGEEDTTEYGQHRAGRDGYEAFLQAVRRFLPKERVYTDRLRRFAWGTDAGFYRLVPQIVIRSENEAEVARILEEAHARRLPVTFRAAGTSLSGQAISDSILVVAGKNWEKITYNEDTTVTLQPGIIGAEVNRRLGKHGRKFGPDPASIGSCMVGGIVMNNASGMSCGTHANSDRCLISARMVLPDGTVLDTGSAESRAAFRRSHPEMVKGIETLRDEVRSDPGLTALIHHKYSIKNVTGLNILPFITYSDPFDIVAHLLVGSEGTLAFLSEVTMKTLPVAPCSASAMIYFPTIRMAAEAVVAMRREKITAAELLDIRSLTAVNDPHLDGTGLKGSAFRRPEGMASAANRSEGLAVSAASSAASKANSGAGMTSSAAIGASSAAGMANSATGLADLSAVLTRTEAEDRETLHAQIARIQEVLEPFGVEVAFSEDPAVTAGYWAIRAGIFPAVGGLRKEGTTCLIEDIAFHIEDLPAATEDLSALLDRHGYDDSCIYGHALEGNFHFIINQSFATEADVRRYEAMIRDVAEMVVGKYGGSLKAEHGTGRNMAPFVRYEWGDKAFSVMQRVKALFDPEGIMNPGVIFNDNPDCFIQNFKYLPVLEPVLQEAEKRGGREENSSGREENSGGQEVNSGGREVNSGGREVNSGGQEAEAFAVDEAVRKAYKQINKCIECGFCEVNCVSCGFTLSPRTRIALRREIARLRGLLATPETADGQLDEREEGQQDNRQEGQQEELGISRKEDWTNCRQEEREEGQREEREECRAKSDVREAMPEGFDRLAVKRQLDELERAYRYYGEETCAGDGLCSTSCPMGINVADLTHQLRRERLGSAGRALGTLAARHFHGAKNSIRGVLALAGAGRAILGTQGMARLGTALHRVTGLPLWTPSTPRAYNAARSASLRSAVQCRTEQDEKQGQRPGSAAKEKVSVRSNNNLKVIYFPSCLNQMMGLPAAPGAPAPYRPDIMPGRPLVEETVALLKKAGYEVVFPENMDSLCCGTIWESKGMPELAAQKTAELEEALWKASEGGRYPILCDQSPCLHRMRKHIKSMKLYEPAEFIYDFLKDRLQFRQTDIPIAVHLTCSTRLMGIGEKLLALARMCSSQVIVPEGVGCCGFAGDKGMTTPELNAYALRKLRSQVNPDGKDQSGRAAVAGSSNSRTCEIGLTTHSGIPYQSIVYLVNACTSALPPQE